MPAYTELNNSAGEGGVPKPVFTDLTMCKTGCNDDATCVGFDYDVNASPICWFFNNADLMKMSTNTRKGVNQYRLTSRCFTGTVSSHLHLHIIQDKKDKQSDI